MPKADKKDKEPEVKKPKKTEKVKKKLPQSLLRDIFQSNIILLQTYVLQQDSKKIMTLYHKMKTFRKLLNAYHLEQLWNTFYPNTIKLDFKSFDDYKVNEKEKFDLSKELLEQLSDTEEVRLYCEGLTLMYLVKQNCLKQALELSEQMLKCILKVNNRYLNTLQAFVLYYYSRTQELLGQLKIIRPRLLEFFRKACIKHDKIGKATLINLILRNYIHYKHYSQANKFMLQTTFPESVYYNEYVRYLYYTALIKTVHLEYQEAFAYVDLAIQKCPDIAQGFRLSAQKLAIVVTLLLGKIPNKNIFTKKEYQSNLYPYFKLCESVHNGDLKQFNEVCSNYEATYEADNLTNIINRLTQNVIKIGLSRINSSYSKIHYKDVAQKLNLDSKADVEFIISKAVRDGVLNARLNHEEQYLTIKQELNMYSTDKPKVEFTKRLDFCVHMYNASQKALEYPDEKQQYKFKKDNKDDKIEDFEEALRQLF